MNKKIPQNVRSGEPCAMGFFLECRFSCTIASPDLQTNRLSSLGYLNKRLTEGIEGFVVARMTFIVFVEEPLRRLSKLRDGFFVGMRANLYFTRMKHDHHLHIRSK